MYIYMKKTTIRINNLFVALDDGDNYFLSNIDDIKIWKKTNPKELKKYILKNNNITDKLHELMEENNIQSNVNFYGFLDTKKENISVTKEGGSS